MGRDRDKFFSRKGKKIKEGDRRRGHLEHNKGTGWFGWMGLVRYKG